MKILIAAGIALASVPVGAQAPQPTPTARASKDQASQIAAFEKSLHPQTGNVAIPTADAVLRLGEDYYFLPADGGLGQST